MNTLDPTATPAWGRLLALHEKYHQLTIKDLFEKPERFERYSVQLDDLLVDYSKTGSTGKYSPL